MKKAIKILGIIVVLILLLGIAATACSGGSGDAGEVKEPSSVSAGGQEAQAKPAESGSEPGSEPDSAPAQTEVTVEEAVLYDQDGITITAKSLDMKGLFGPELKLLIENGGARSVTVQARSASVNGYMAETMMSADVAPGKKANESLTFLRSDLDAAGIETVADLEFSFHIFDTETWDTVADSEPIQVKTSAAEGYTYTFDDSGNQVYNENGVEIVVKGLSEDASWLGSSVVVYISNTGSRGITVQARDVSVNGFMAESIFSCDVAAGKRAIDTVTFLESDLAENGIEEIESVELSFHVFDMETWDTVTDTPPVTINFGE